MMEGLGVSVRFVLVLHELRGFGERRETSRYKEDVFYTRHIMGIVYLFAKQFLSQKLLTKPSPPDICIDH